MNADDYRDIGWRFARLYDQDFGKKGSLHNISEVADTHKTNIIRNAAILLEMIANTDNDIVPRGC